MEDSKDSELRQLVGKHEKLIYEMVKLGQVDRLSPENQSLARAMSEHMHLRHVHNALEFADVHEGEPYEIEVDDNVVSPMAHLVMHAAVKGQIAENPPVRAAFAKLVATGTDPHHAEHMLGVLSAELFFDLTQGAAGTGPEKASAAFYRKIKKLTQDATYRKKLKRQVPADHYGFD